MTTALVALIAVTSVLTTVLLARLYGRLRTLGSQMDRLARDLERGVAPTLQDVGRASRNLAEISERLARQSRRVDALLADAVVTVEHAQAAVGDALPLLARMASFAAGARLLRRGLRAYRKLRRR